MKFFSLLTIAILMTFSDTFAREKIISENDYSCLTQDNIEFCVDINNMPLSGKIEKTDEKGNIVLLSYYKDGYRNGLTTEYKKGKIFRKAYYKKGLNNGEYKEFFENNVINISATYKNGELSGNVERYNEKGDLIGRFRYKDGYLVKGFCQYKKEKKKNKREVNDSGYNQIINCEE